MGHPILLLRMALKTLHGNDCCAPNFHTNQPVLFNDHAVQLSEPIFSFDDGPPLNAKDVDSAFVVVSVVKEKKTKAKKEKRERRHGEY